MKKIFLIALLLIGFCSFCQEINFSQRILKCEKTQKRIKRLQQLKDSEYYQNKQKLIQSINTINFVYIKYNYKNTITCFNDFCFKNVFSYKYIPYTLTMNILKYNYKSSTL